MPDGISRVNIILNIIDELNVPDTELAPLVRLGEKLLLLRSSECN